MEVPDDECPYCTRPSPTASADTRFSEEPPPTPSFPPVTMERFENQSYEESSHANQEQGKGKSSSGDSQSSTLGTVQGYLKRRISELVQDLSAKLRKKESSERSAEALPVALPEALPEPLPEALPVTLPEALPKPLPEALPVELGSYSSGDFQPSTESIVHGYLKWINIMPEEHFEDQRPEDPQNANQAPQLAGPNEDSEVTAGTVPIALPEAVPVAVVEAQQEQLPEVVPVAGAARAVARGIGR